MKLKFLLLFLLLLVPLASAETAFFVKWNETYDMKISCDKDGIRCTGNCNITIEYPNSTILIDDGIMSNLNNGYYNYTLLANQTNVVGEHKTRVECIDSGLNDTAIFIYEVNPAGIRATDQRTESITRSIYFIFGIGILLFIAFLFTSQSVPVKWTFFIFSIIFFLIAINIVFVSLEGEVVDPRLENFFEGFTAISWIFYWFAAGLLILIWILTFFNTFFLRKNLRTMKKAEGIHG